MNWTTTGLVSPGNNFLMALSTVKPPKGVRGSMRKTSSLTPTFLMRISLIYLFFTGTSPKSSESTLGTMLRVTVVVLAYK